MPSKEHTSYYLTPPKNAKVHSKKDYLTIRNETVKYIKEKKVEAWKTKYSFGRRNRVENTFYRIKTIFGRSYVSRKWENQKGKTRLLCHLLNQMTTLGMSKAVKVA